jgi:transcriptional regulator with XRE-family HTH domain
VLDLVAIIMHDNSVKASETVSQQLRRRRLELGLSLTEAARRAGTSPATLSRYEHGWSRFETYTLRKLAAALDCDLTIQFRPRTRRGSAGVDRAAAEARLKRIFWDHPFTLADLDTHAVWVVERVLEYGNLDDVHMLRELMGKESFLRAVSAANRVSPRTRNFWTRILDMEGISCAKKYSRGTAWNS